jgi:uncharacterized membrane protein (DUF2068 family)
VTYKLGKAAVQLAAAGVLWAALMMGATTHLHQIAAAVVDQGTSRWSLLLARAGLQVTTPRHVHLAIAALALDGGLSLVEGWGLHRRYRWAPWLIVAATASALPIEVVGLVRALRPVRVLVLIINLILVVYLLRRAARHTTRSVARVTG